MLLQAMKKKLTRKSVLRIIGSVAMMVFSVMMLYPLIYMLLGALSSREDYMNAGFLPIPQSIPLSRLSNFVIFFKGEGIIGSIFITLARTLFYAFTTVFFSAIGGYLFAKVNFRGKGTLFAVYMSTMMIPGIALMVPSYLIIARFPLVGGNNILGQGGMGFIDNFAVLFVTGWINVYNIFLMRQSMISMGDELKEAAEIDGSGKFRIIFTIYLPLCLPIICVMMTGLFIGMWNDYMTSLIYLPTMPELQTVGTKIIDIINDMGTTGYDTIPNYPVVYGISVTFMIPPIVVFLIFQKQMISGLALGAVKG